MKPLVAIVGRPNVGKSTLFNRIVGERIAIVEDLPGTTRDRIYADGEWNGRIFTLVDTGGLDLGGIGDFSEQITAQAQLAIEEADVIVFLVDVRDGITATDRDVAAILRRSKKPVVLGANKADNAKQRQEAVEFYELGLGEPITLSSISGTGSGEILDAVVEALPPQSGEDEEDETPGIPRIAIVGRPNTGKSSLVNAILGQDRVIVSDIPGTTRDTIDSEVEHDGQRMILIDTAGIRRRGRIGQGVEKFSALRAHRAIDRCDVAVLMIDGVEGITAQDVHIAGYVHEAAKGIVVVINKWDLVRERRRAAEELADPDRPVSLIPGQTPAPAVTLGDADLVDAKQYQRAARASLKFVPYAPLIFAAAKTRYHVGPILDEALKIYDTRQVRVPTPRLNDVVRDAVQRHQPPFIQGRQLKLYYATQANVNPPTFVFFVNDPSLRHFSYERYLENQLREAFGFAGTTIRVQFRARTTDRDGEQDGHGREHKRRTAHERKGSGSRGGARR